MCHRSGPGTGWYRHLLEHWLVHRHRGVLDHIGTVFLGLSVLGVVYGGDGQCCRVRRRSVWVCSLHVESVHRVYGGRV